MTLLKIIWYLITSAFTFKYRTISKELSADGKPIILLWGVATDKGWKLIKDEMREKYD